MGKCVGRYGEVWGKMWREVRKKVGGRKVWRKVREGGGGEGSWVCGEVWGDDGR